MFRSRVSRQHLVVGVVGAIVLVAIGLVVGPERVDPGVLYVLAAGWLFGSVMLGIYRG